MGCGRDGTGRADPALGSLSLEELQGRLTATLWADLSSGEPIDADRQSLQRDQITLLTQWLLAPPAAGRAEMRMQMQRQARELLARLDRVRYRSDASPETLAHLKDSAQRLREAMQARVMRAGV